MAGMTRYTLNSSSVLYGWKYLVRLYTLRDSSLLLLVWPSCISTGGEREVIAIIGHLQTPIPAQKSILS